MSCERDVRHKRLFATFRENFLSRLSGYNETVYPTKDPASDLVPAEFDCVDRHTDKETATVCDALLQHSQQILILEDWK